MEQIEQTKKKLSTNEKIKILFCTLAGLGVGGVLGPRDKHARCSL